MRVLAVARFRLMTIVRSGTPIVVLVALPPLLAMIPLSVSAPWFRANAPTMLAINARAAILAWLWHAFLIGLAALQSGKVRIPASDVILRVIPDLMDTAPVGPRARFWGEALGTLGAMLMIHACCLPLLAAVAALSPFPTPAFLRMETGTISMIVLGSAGAAWLRRAPRTKHSDSRGARNAVLFMILLIVIVRSSTTEIFRDALFRFVSQRTSLQGWADVVGATENPLLLFTLLSALYAGYIAYYYVSATRQRAGEI